MERKDITQYWPLLLIPVIIMLLVAALAGAKALRPTGDAASVPAPATTPIADLPESIPVTTEVDQTGYVKGIYVSYAALGDANFQAHVKNLLETTELNAVVMDFKGDRGYLSFPSSVPLAQEIGAASQPTVKNPEEFLKWYKDRDVYLIARIVTFKDNLLTRAYPGYAVTDAVTGGVWKDAEKLGWLDPNLHVAWDYNIALAQEAARMGFDEVQFDYVRFPTDGAIGRAIFSLPNTSEQRVAALTGFLKRAHEAVKPLGAQIGADVFGYAPWVMDDLGIGQHLESIAPYLDVLSPMVYPSTYEAGLPGDSPEYRNAIAYPYDIVQKVTERAVTRALAANPAMVVRPWIQDFQDYAFDWRIYTPAEIRAQMDGARDGGGRGWLLWDPAVQYTPAALLSAAPSYTPNTAGMVPVLAYGSTTAPEGQWSPESLRADLERLLAAGYYPVTLYDFVQMRLGMAPAGKRPVVLTFDGATEDQFRLLPDGSVDPRSAVGVLQAFHETHPLEWPLRATFFVPPAEQGAAFGQPELAARKIELLAVWGIEVGGQVANSVDLSTLSAEDVQRELTRPHVYVASLLPGYDIYSLNVPDGKAPADAALLAQDPSGAGNYSYGATVGLSEGLAPSFHAPDFDPYDIPRVPVTPEGPGAALSAAHKVGVGYVSAGE